MSGLQQSIFFLRLPDLKKLCCVALSLQGENEEPRSRQLKTCRQLVLMYSDILASPALDSFTDITVVMAIPFFQKRILQAFAQRHGLQMAPPQCLFPGVLQCCVSYSLICRLAPSWNKAGLYLITGKDFLTGSGRQNAVSLQMSTSEGQLCLSVEANSVRLPPIALEDFNLPPLVLRRFCSDPESVLNPSSSGGNIWCHVLPSMKKGQIITISRQLPKDGPFKTYRELQNHWNCLYGYRLPEVAEEEVVYCSVYFRLVGERLFTYPLSCVRLQPLQRLPRVDLQGALSCFLSDVRQRLQSVCGFPAHLTGKPCYSTVSLSSAASLQVLSADQVNLSSSSSLRSALNQLPPPLPPRPLKPFLGSQPPSLPPQYGAQGLLGNRRGFTQSQGPPSSSSSSSSSFSSLVSFSSSSFPPLPPNKLVPIFRNKFPSRHVNTALLRLQKQREGGGRVTLPTLKTPPTSSSTSLSAASLPVPRFSRRPATHSSLSNSNPNLKHILTLSPVSKCGLAPPPKPEIKPRVKFSSDANSEATLPSAAKPPDDRLASSSSEGVESESKKKKQRSAVGDMDVAQMTQSNQLSKLNTATLSAWLRGRGVQVTAKLRKEDLMLKVMGCLAEA
ncbi:hypothetical protein PBY51_013853 [Eleginops maclovinus]|uniref:DUF4708 domain-containing protein n=1 Tax=Eleginops maclovinus TaxID=56733 RepID=A0AAN7WVS4_ELEMC|nr:hypothetical protein PBY51_013853 [Eleginops maclovinus]